MHLHVYNYAFNRCLSRLTSDQAKVTAFELILSVSSQNISTLVKIAVKGNNVTGQVDSIKYVETFSHHT